MKVGFLAAAMLPEEGGGYTLSEDVLSALKACESESRHRFQVYTRRKQTTLRSKSALRRTLTRNSTRPVPKWVRRLYPDALREQQRKWTERAWTRSLNGDGIDILWSALPEVPTFELPFIVPVWDLEHRLQPYFPEMSRAGEWNRREELFATMLRRATFVITGTRAGAEQIEFLYQVPAARIRILPHPTPEFARAASAGQLGDALQAHGIQSPYVFYPAQFWPHKNHVGVLHAVHAARQRTGVDLRVVFAGGDVGSAAHVRSVARTLDMEACVHFLGFVDQASLIALYRGALAVTYLSFCGPENLPPLEAFALGCPVIAADIPGALEQLGDAALLVPPTNSCSAATALVNLINDPQLRATLIERGHARAHRFTAPDYVRGVFALLDEFEHIRQSWH